MRSPGVFAQVLALLLAAPLLAAPPRGPMPSLPPLLTDTAGKVIDVQQLAQHHQLFFVTLKATWCPVCVRQLLRLKDKLDELKACGASFIVLSPGPGEDLRKIKERTQFPYPFVEDIDLKLARRLDLVLQPGQIVPAIFAVDAQRRISWMQYGRNGAYYGDEALLHYLNCAKVRRAALPFSTPRPERLSFF